jgi:hypothetical protein
MKKCLTVTAMLAVLGSTVILSSFLTTFVLAQDTPRNEEYTEQHDGGDRAEYLQELEHSDPLFYVPPVNGTSSQAEANNTPTN